MEYLFFTAITLCLIVAILLVAAPFRMLQKKYADKSLFFYILLIAIILILSIFMYTKLGNYKLQKNAWISDAFMAQMKSPQQLIEKLKARVQQEPTSEGWYLLGRLYLSQQQYLDAQAAFAKAAALAPGNPIILNNYALSCYLNRDYQQAIKLWQRVLTIIPAGSEDAKLVKQAIQKAQSEMKQSKLKKIKK